MPLFGYDDIRKMLMRLADARELSHAYLFFGESQVGKFLCAQSLANYIERGTFEEPTKQLQETLIIDLSKQTEGEESIESIGITSAREATRFVKQMSALSPYRMVIIRDAEWLTDQAQNALLKTLEEPPAHSVLILIASHADVFLPAVASRLQKIYFKTLSEERMGEYAHTLDLGSRPASGSPTHAPKGLANEDLVIQNPHKILARRYRVDFSDKSAIIDPRILIQNSVGRIGRLIALLHPTKQSERIQQLTRSILATPATDAARDALIDEILLFDQKHPQNLFLLCEELLVQLRAQKKYVAAGAVVSFITKLQTLSVSKRIHLKELLCLIL